MESRSDHPPLIAIVGPTATGKTELALDMAKQFSGEIIAADSRTVYKGMDIGTAKPSASDRAQIRHHLIDIRQPNEPFTAADFQRLAKQAINEIASRGKVPFLVGGSGLYIDALLYDYEFMPPPDLVVRSHYQSMSIDKLQAELIERKISLPHNTQNPLHLIRRLETGGITPHHSPLRPRTVIIGVDLNTEALHERITARIEYMFASGLHDEVAKLVTHFGWDAAVLQTISYQEFQPYFNGKATLGSVKTKIISHTKQYVKRQRTWFRRNKSIHWIKDKAETVDLITSLLNK